jgi:hypothetical protein
VSSIRFDRSRRSTWCSRCATARPRGNRTNVCIGSTPGRSTVGPSVSISSSGLHAFIVCDSLTAASWINGVRIVDHGFLTGSPCASNPSGTTSASASAAAIAATNGDLPPPPKREYTARRNRNRVPVSSSTAYQRIKKRAWSSVGTNGRNSPHPGSQDAPTSTRSRRAPASETRPRNAAHATASTPHPPATQPATSRTSGQGPAASRPHHRHART